VGLNESEYVLEVVQTNQELAAMAGKPSERPPYEAPELVVIGALEELTLGCDKNWGQTDGFTFQGSPIACASA
jgi:hypothetical protein